MDFIVYSNLSSTIIFKIQYRIIKNTFINLYPRNKAEKGKGTYSKSEGKWRRCLPKFFILVGEGF